MTTAEFPITNALNDLLRRANEAVVALENDDSADAFARAASTHFGSLVTGVSSAVAALESEIYMLRAQLGIEAESPFDPPVGVPPWKVAHVSAGPPTSTSQ